MSYYSQVVGKYKQTSYSWCVCIARCKKVMISLSQFKEQVLMDMADYVHCTYILYSP